MAKKTSPLAKMMAQAAGPAGAPPLEKAFPFTKGTAMLPPQKAPPPKSKPSGGKPFGKPFTKKGA